MWLAALAISPKAVVLFFLRLYSNRLSLLFAPRCRFFPSCSHYAHDAIEQHGILFGGLLAVKRLSRCHPFHPGGFDAVPAARDCYIAPKDSHITTHHED